MEHCSLGGSELQVSRVCFGAWAMGGIGWGEVRDEETIAAARHAFELGVNFYDTADLYGDGHSERVLGDALRDVRDDVIIATKGGRRSDGAGRYWTDGSPGWLKQAVDLSLDRLGVDHVDLYQLHWPDPDVPIEDSVGALDEIRQAGKARFIGVSNCGPEELGRALAACQIVSNQIPVNMYYREHIPDTLPFCAEHGVGVMAYGSLAQGLLTGKFGPDTTFAEGEVRANSPLFAPDSYPRNLQLVEALRPLAERLGRTLAQLAVNWVIRQDGVVSAICGAKRPSQIADNVGGVDWALSDDELAAIETLLPPSTPSPRPLK